MAEETWELAVEKHVAGGMTALNAAQDPVAPNYDAALKKLGAHDDVTAFLKEATGQGPVGFAAYIEPWLAYRKPKVIAKNIDDDRFIILKFQEDFPTLDTVTKRGVKAWFFQLDMERIGTKRQRKYKYSLQNYWTFLKYGMEHTAVPEELEPFQAILFPKESKRSKSKGWKSFPNLGKDVGRLLAAAKNWEGKSDRQLYDLILVALFTGMRIMECCSLKITDVHQDHIHVTESKTDAGVRDIPIHKNFKNRLKRLVEDSKDGYVISGLKPKNKYGSRSSAIGKRFGKLKTKLGYGDQYVFHSIRHTFVSILNRNKIRTPVIKDLVGHEQGDFTLRTYDDIGSTMEERQDAINTLDYPSWLFIDNDELAKEI